MYTKKLEELIASNEKIAELLHMKKESPTEEKNNTLLWILAIIGAIAAVALIAYAVYRHMHPAYSEDDLDCDFEEEIEEDMTTEDITVEEEPVAEEATEETTTEETVAE